MERGKKFVQNFVQGKKAMSSTQALLQDIEDVVFQQTSDAQAHANGEPYDEELSSSESEDRDERERHSAGNS
ncbi:MAG: hypothetical protein K9J81_03655 [Desulfohalobiaceae bacterium]|nr:hypothetical protein [Desulfohalobiaceae bacterium]